METGKAPILVHSFKQSVVRAEWWSKSGPSAVVSRGEFFGGRGNPTNSAPLFHHRHFPLGRAAKRALSSRAPIKHVKDGSLPPSQPAPILLGEKMRKTGTEGSSGDRMRTDCEGVGLSVKGVPRGPRPPIDGE
ncbi:uncharacterized [Tachysurus ichikawai]